MMLYGQRPNAYRYAETKQTRVKWFANGGYRDVLSTSPNSTSSGTTVSVNLGYFPSVSWQWNRYDVSISKLSVLPDYARWQFDYALHSSAAHDAYTSEPGFDQELNQFESFSTAFYGGAIFRDHLVAGERDYSLGQRITTFSRRVNY